MIITPQPALTAHEEILQMEQHKLPNQSAVPSFCVVILAQLEKFVDIST